MSWFYEQSVQQDVENYQSYRITQALRGKMAPSFEGAVRLINSKRKDGQNGYQHHVIHNSYFSNGRGDVPG